MTSVKKADPNTSKIVTVMKNIVGPFSIDPVFRASHAIALLTPSSMKRAHPTQIINTQRAVRPDPALTNATERARSVHPTIRYQNAFKTTDMYFLTDVIRHTSRKNDNANCRVEELEFGKNATKNREGSNGKRDTSKEHEMCERDIFGDELIVYGI